MYPVGRSSPPLALRELACERSVAVDRRKRGSEHHLICDGHGTRFKVITIAANVNVTVTAACFAGVHE